MATVLWLGDAGCHTGFATVTHGIGERLVRDHGHDVHVLATNYDGDFWPSNMKLYVPTKMVGHDLYGQARFVEMLGIVEPDVVVILNDPYVVHKFLFRNNWDPQKILLQYRPILAYMPVDGQHQPSTWDVLKKVTKPVLMSHWGRTWAPLAPVVWHGIDTDIYRPATPERPMFSSGGYEVTDKRSAKIALNYDPNSFLVLRVDRNSRRKDFASTWKALVPVMKRHKDIIAHFHCKPTGEDGVELPQLFSRDPETGTRFYTPGNHSTRVGWPEQDLAILYNAADLFVSTSWGEGFGLTLAEAVACGTPVIAQDVSSITEVVGPAGILIPPACDITVTSGQDLWLPNVAAFTEAIEHLYTAGAERAALAEIGPKHASQFSWDVAAARFSGFIEKLVAEDPDTGTTGAVAQEDPS